MAEEEDLSSLSLEARLQHKSWKARVSGYEELAGEFRKTISEDDAAFGPYLRDPSVLRAAIIDANAVCQEKGIECCCAFIEYGGRAAAVRSREAFTSALVEKSVFGVTRAGTKKAATELCLLLVECEESADGVFEACTEGLKSKQPKAVAGAVAVMKEIVKQFGAKTINVKPVLKVIPAIFAHADKGVRAEGTYLVQELHRWLGSALDPHLAELKPVQIKELNESFVNEDKPEQTRFTRSQQRERARKEAEASLSGAGAAANDEAAEVDTEDDAEGEADVPDAFDFAEPANVLDKLPEGFYENLSSSKWKDRKELALDPLLDMLKKYPRLQEASYDELVRSLAGRMTDANIACVISAAGCLEQLAKGLRGSFGRFKSAVVPPLLERCKEKKASVTDALGAALDAVFASVSSISDITEDITAFSKHKNPQVKEQTYKWLVRCLSSTRVAPNVKTDLKPLTDALLHGFEDSFEPVRSAAAEGLGTLLKILGERAMGSTMEGLDDIRKAKVKEFSEKAQVKCKAGAPAPSKPAAAVAPARLAPVTKAAPPKPKPLQSLSTSGGDKENTPPASSAPPTPKAAVRPAGAIRKPPVLSSMSSAAAKKPAPPAAAAKAAPIPAGKPAPSANEPIKYRFTQEDAEAQAESVIPPEIFADLGNSNWKARLAAIEALQTWLETDGAATEAELIVRTLSKKPGWKESNFQVYGKVAGVCQFLAERSQSWTRACSALTIGPLSDKLGDIKIKKPAGDALTAYAEKFSLQFVLNHAYDPMTKQKAPKAQADAMLWVEQAIREFGIQGLAIRDLIEFLKTGLKSSNALVRTNATKTLVTLRLYVGPDIKTFIQDLNPQLLSTIESDFDKVNGEAAPAPTRTSGDNAPAPSAAASSTAGAAKASAGGSDPLDDLFPRQDLDKLIPHSVVVGIGDANWKQRKESLEQVQGILEANKRLKPTMGELGPALKARMTDSNKMVQGLALDAISRIAAGMNKPFEKHARMFVGPICPILADAKANVRAPALVALSAIFEHSGLDCMVHGLTGGLEAANPIQRKELATWLGEKLAEGNVSADLAPLAAPTIACLEDRSAEVRKAAQALLPFIIASAGYAHVMDQTSGMKPASRSTVIPMIEAAKGAAGSAPGAARQSTVNQAVSGVSRPSSSASSNLPTSATSGAFPAKPAVRGVAAITRTLKPATASSIASSRSITPNSASGDMPVMPSPAKSSLMRKPASARQSLLPGAQPMSQPSNSQSGAPEPPIRSIDPKAKLGRAARETGPLKWAIEGSARPDQVDFLHQQMIPHFSHEVVNLLFSKDHHNERDFMAGLSILEECMLPTGAEKYGMSVDELRDAVKANTDMIFKYLTVRLADTATTMTIKCLEVTESLFSMMLEDGYQLEDYEAGAFFPSVIGKLGDGKEPIRARVKAILRSTGSIYPSSKTFAALLEHGLHSKNARTRSETLEELGYLIQRQGMNVCPPSKALPAIAALISDKDASCRSAALATIACAYAAVGDAVYKHIGQLPDKEMTMLDEKLKRVPGGTSSPAPSRVVSGAATPKRPDSRQEQQLPRADPRTGSNAPVAGPSRLPASAAVAGAKRRQSALPVPGGHLPVSSASGLRASHLPQTQSHPAVPAVPAAKSRSASPEQALSAMTAKQRMVTDEAAPAGMMQRQNSFEPDSPFSGVLSPDPTASVEALKIVQRQITEDTATLAAQADQLMAAITMQMSGAFEGLHADTPQATLRLCKHLMQTLSAFFDQKTLSLAVSRESLVGLLAELTKRLLETAASEASEAISSLSKVLNMVLIRIFHNATRASTFGALFEIMQTATADMRELAAADLAERAKYAELVMKCLWKVSKSVKETLEDRSLDSRHLLLYIDRFLTTIPPAEWRRRASDSIPLGDMPLRTIKTILQQVVAAFGDAVYEELSLIDRPENSFVYQYLFRLLNNSRQVSAEGTGGEILSRQSSTISHASSTLIGRQKSSDAIARQGSSISARNGSKSPALSGAAVPQASPGRSADIEMNLALKAIFDKIGNTNESKAGIAELYEFKKQHPEAEARINTWITATGSYFQSYLKRALSNLAAEEAERASPATGSSLSPSSNRPMSVFGSNGYASPSLDGTASPRASRVSSAASANDDKLASLKQRFGVGPRAAE